MRKLVICEPHCKGSSHESFNSAYIYALCTLYKERTVCFFADKDQIQAIKSIFNQREIVLPNLLFEPIDFSDDPFIMQWTNDFLLIIDKIQLFLRDEDLKSVFFTSIFPSDIEIVKRTNLKCVCIIHGFLERLNRFAFIDVCKNLYQLKKIIHPILFSLLHKIHHPIETIHSHILLNKEHKRKKKLLNKQVCLKMLTETDPKQFSFIFLSSHIINNLSKIVKLRSNFFYIPLLEIQPILKQRLPNPYPKFAIYGYGVDNNLFNNLALQLEKKKLQNYELRNISMRTYPNLENCSHVKQIGKGFIDKKEMEKQAEDIDFFLNFYTPHTYKYTCSGSIVEAITYLKPVIYIKNDCYKSYNEPYNIGIECRNVNEMKNIIEFIVLNWDSYQEKYQIFQKNLNKKREEINILNQLDNLHKATSIFENK